MGNHVGGPCAEGHGFHVQVFGITAAGTRRRAGRVGFQPLQRSLTSDKWYEDIENYERQVAMALFPRAMCNFYLSRFRKSATVVAGHTQLMRCLSEWPTGPLVSRVHYLARLSISRCSLISEPSNSRARRPESSPKHIVYKVYNRAGVSSPPPTNRFRISVDGMCFLQLQHRGRCLSVFV